MGDDFKLEFSFDPKNQLRPIKYSLVFYLGAVGGLIYFLVMHEVVGLYIAVGFFILIIPQVLIHLQYFLNDRRLQITVNHSAKQLIIHDRTNEVLRYDDIERIIRHKSQLDEKNVTYALPFAFYNHSEIKFKDGRSVYFTDFITSDLGIKEIPKSENRRFLNFLDVR